MHSGIEECLWYSSGRMSKLEPAASSHMPHGETIKCIYVTSNEPFILFLLFQPIAKSFHCAIVETGHWYMTSILPRATNHTVAHQCIANVGVVPPRYTALNRQLQDDLEDPLGNDACDYREDDQR